MLLRPDAGMNQIIVYLLAVIANRTGMQVHAVCAMSTHIHLVVTDVEGRLPTFLQAFHRLVALCTMVYRRWTGGIWDKSATSVVRLETPVAVVEKIAYVIANPVAAGLVRHAHEWPGATVSVDAIGKGTMTARRPDVYLNPKNWADEATLQLSLPPTVGPGQEASFRDQVKAELDRLEAEAHAESREQGRRFLGAARARTVSPMARATTVELTFDRNPTFAVGRGQGEDWEIAAAMVEAFRASYRAAFDQWCAGARSVPFPPGTWLMRILHGAAVNSTSAAA
jgi:hypothetical protein